MNVLRHATRIAALHTGVPMTTVHRETGRSYETSIARTRRTAAMVLEHDGFVGDRSADATKHGGPDQAVCVYPSEHLTHWSRAFGRHDITPGCFGENVTLDGVDERDVAVGDVWSVGTARVQVSQPRTPCWKLEHHLAIDGLVGDVRESGRTGWYLRVLDPGHVAPGDRVNVVARPWAALTIDRVNRARREAADQQLLHELRACSALGARWKAFFARGVARASEQA